MAEAAKQRMFFVDNLRLAMIALVVLVHAGVTESGLGNWYFVDPGPKGPLSLLALTLFLAAHRNGWLRTLDPRLARRCLLLALPGFAVLALMVWPVVSSPDVAAALTPFRGGWTWESLFLSSWESAMGVCLSLGLLGLFRERANATTPFLGELTGSAFAVYVFHAPLVVVLGRMVAPLDGPALVKFLVLGALSLPVSFGVAWFVRRAPGLRELVKA